VEYGIKKQINLSYDEAIEKIKKELSKEGFGVLTEIDVKATLKKKIDVDFDKYVILGACNPNLAYKALQSEQDIGLLLPCNVIVYEKNNITYVSAIDPTIAMNFVEGHVPTEAVLKLLNENPDVKGITLPGMPTGTPGMPGPKTAPYKVFKMNNDNSFDEFITI
jgi:uncharacterized protein (DUF302 family)